MGNLACKVSLLQLFGFIRTNLIPYHQILRSFGYLKYFPEILYRILKFEVLKRQCRRIAKVKKKNESKIEMDKEKMKILRKKKDMARVKRAITIYSKICRY